MRFLGALLALALAGAALRAALALALVIFVILKPMETLKFVAGMMCLGIIARFPVPAMLTVGAVVIAGKLAPKSG